VYGIRRRADALPSPLRTVRADVTDATGLAARLPRSPDRVYIILTPARYDEDAYRRTYVDGVTGVLTGRNRLLNRVREQAPCPADPPVYT
ncbi:hypothetical protein, partial [Klebsiella pneumoniae]